jgi:hypothetical protein
VFDDTIEVLSYTSITVRGRVVPDYSSTPTAVPITGVDVQPGVTQEMVETHRAGSEVQFTVYIPAERIPAGVTINALSVIRYDGERFQVSGRPDKWTGHLAHRVVYLTDWAAS